eukprot:PhF_6_TR43485/c0_g1_i1/m.66752
MSSATSKSTASAPQSQRTPQLSPALGTHRRTLSQQSITKGGEGGGRGSPSSVSNSLLLALSHNAFEASVARFVKEHSVPTNIAENSLLWSGPTSDGQDSRSPRGGMLRGGLKTMGGHSSINGPTSASAPLNEGIRAVAALYLLQSTAQQKVTSASTNSGAASVTGVGAQASGSVQGQTDGDKY